MATESKKLDFNALFDAPEAQVISKGARIKVEFENFEDWFIGVYEGSEMVINPNDGDTWLQLNFEGVDYFSKVEDEHEDIKGIPCAINPGYELSRSMEKVEKGWLVKISYARDLEMADAKKNAMRSFVVSAREMTPELKKSIFG